MRHATPWVLAAVLCLAGAAVWVFSRGEQRTAQRSFAPRPAVPPLERAVVDPSPAAGTSTADSAALQRGTGVPLTVRLRDWTGAPVLGARVTAEAAPMETAPAETAPQSALEAKDQGDGSYLLDALEERRTRIVARAEGLASEEAWWDPQDGESVEMELVAPVCIGGMVLSLDGKPVAGTRIEGAWQRPHDWGKFLDSVVTDDAGRFLFAAIRPGFGDGYTLDVRAPGHISRWARAEAGDEELEIVLIPGSVILGRVVESKTGRPIADARAYASGGGFMDLPCDDTRTGDDGRFELYQVPPGKVDLFLESKARTPRELEGLEVPLRARIDVGTIPLTRHAGVTLLGHVLLLPGRTPLGGVRVEAWPAPEETGEDEAGARRTATSSENGQFVLEDLAPGRWTATAKPERGPVLAHLELTVGPSAPDPLEIAVDLRDSIVGRVVEKDGTPVQGARVFLGYTGQDPSTEVDALVPHLEEECAPCDGLLTRADGSFRIRGLPAFPRYGVIAVLQGRRFAWRTGLVVDDTSRPDPLELELPPAGTIRGRVVDPNSRGLPRAGVRASLSDDWKGDLKRAPVGVRA